MIEVMSTIHIVVHVVKELLLANRRHSQGEYRFCLDKYFINLQASDIHTGTGIYF